MPLAVHKLLKFKMNTRTLESIPQSPQMVLGIVDSTFEC